MTHTFLMLFLVFAFTLPPAAKALTVMVFVYGVIQALKQAPVLQPYLTGWLAVVVNVVFTTLGVWIAIPAAAFWSSNTFILLLTTALGAAGIHGTAKSLTTSTSAPSAPAVKAVSILLLGTLLIPFCTGCTGWERGTYQTLAATKATIDQAHIDYEAKTIPQSQVNYTLINQAIAAQTVAVNAMMTYESVKASGGTSSALTTAQNAVDAALVQLPPLIVSIKALYTATK